MQNNINPPKVPATGGTSARDPSVPVRQGRTEVLRTRQDERQLPQEARGGHVGDFSASGPEKHRGAHSGSVGTSDEKPPVFRNPQQIVVGIPRSEKKEQREKQTVIIDSPDIDADSRKKNKKEKSCSSVQKEKGFYFQRPGEVSTLRKLLIIVFGLLFLWCLAPAFFNIMGIGVISSSAVMLGICLTAMFWHLIDRNWTFGKAAAVLLAALLFAACVAGFAVVSGMMLKASLAVAPPDCPNYTVVVLGCKAQGDQPSWMLNDRLDKAYSILRDNPKIKCVVTGGKGDDEQFTEAYVMRKYLVEKGISPDRIYMEELSDSTEENLLYSKAVIRLNGLSENIVIVTDRFHELRARIWAEKAGFENIYSGCCETRIYLVTGYWFREMFGLARLYVFGK